MGAVILAGQGGSAGMRAVEDVKPSFLANTG